MRIVYLGSSNFSLPTLKSIDKSDHQLIAIVTHPDKIAGRGKVVTPSIVKIKGKILGYPILEPNNLNTEETIKLLKDCSPDVFVIVAFQKLPDSILNIPRIGSINLHPSLLPIYRGAAPIQWSLLNGDRNTGITIIELSSKIDAGNIIFQRKYKIEKDENYGTLSDRLSKVGALHIMEQLDKIKKTNSINGIKQNNNNITYAPKLFNKDYYIDWSDTSKSISCKIRAFSPLPGARTKYKTKIIKIFDSQIIDKKTIPEIDLKYSDKILKLDPRKIFMSKHNIYTGTGDGTVLIKKLQLEGKRIINSKEFISGYYNETSEFNS